ncbi:MAG: hypothetical protein R6W84_17890 [Promethearchaeia archaeon]
MFFESIFMIRGGIFGYDFSVKLLIALFGITLCYYDWKENEKRLDYFWVFLIGTLIWSLAEFLLQLVGIRELQDKFFFGINITSCFWFTIPLQGMSEGAFVALINLFVGDRLLDKEKRKEGLFVLFGYHIINFGITYSILFSLGYNFLNVNVGDLSVPSRRDIFTIPSLIYLALFIAPFIYWYIRTNKRLRKRANHMFLLMLITVSIWTLLEWLTGQRWIEVGIKTSEGTYSNLTRAPPLIEFLALAYDVVIEIVLMYMPFLAIPYLLGLIKSE